MLHNFQVMLGTLTGGLIGHLEQWEGWAVLIASALFGYRSAPLWIPIVVALIIDPLLYGLIANLVHGRNPGLSGLMTYTVLHIAVAYAGYVAGRLIARFR